MVESLFSTAADDPVDSAEYRSVDPWCVGALLVGLLSPLALIDKPWWLVPLVGIVVAAIALARLKADPSRVGRFPALFGLAVSICFAVAPIAQVLSSELILAPQPLDVADQWFAFLREDRPELAYELTLNPDYRRFDESVWLVFKNDEKAENQLRTFVGHPLVRTLLALGERAKARFYKTEWVITWGDRAQLANLYTVTFTDDAGQKKTFFVRLIMDRRPTKKDWLSPWRVQDFIGGVAPI